MLEKAVEILDGKVDINNPQHVYKTVTSKRFGLGEIVKKDVEHPLAKKALQLDHARKIAVIHHDTIQHLETLVSAFLHGQVHDNIAIAKNNQRYALCGAFVVMHHHLAVQALPHHTLEEILHKHDAVSKHITRLKAFEDGLEEDMESVHFVILKRNLTGKRNTLRLLSDDLKRYAETEKKRILTPETIKEESGSPSPSTSSSDILTINIGNADNNPPNPLATPPSSTHTLKYSPEEVDSSSPIKPEPIVSGTSSPYLHISNSPSHHSSSGRTDSTQIPLSLPFANSRSSSSPAIFSTPNSSPTLSSSSIPSTSPSPTLLTPHDHVDTMLNIMKTKGQWTPTIARDLQENYFMTWIGQQTRETLLYLSGHMQNVQSGIVADRRFARIREDYFYIPNCNTSQWTKLRHAVKLAIIELQREDGLKIVVDGIEKVIVSDEKDEINRAHLSWHAGRFFTHWGKTTTLTVYESDFIAESKIHPSRGL